MRPLLLVEDDPDDILLLKKGLERAGGVDDLLIARDGAEALDVLRTLRPPPALLVLDLKLPRATGLDVLRGLRGADATRHVPAAVLTSSRERSDIAAAYALGADAYLVKPVGFEELRALAATLRRGWLALSRGEPFVWPNAQPRPSAGEAAK